MMNLPEHEPDPNLWQRIEAGLDTNAQIDRMLHALPQPEPDEQLWDRIETQLSQTPVVLIGQRTRQLMGSVRWLAGAAAVVLLVGYWGWQYKNTPATERVTISYSVEKNTRPAPPAPALAKANQQAEALIAYQCAEQHPVCQKPEVHTLRNQLVELKHETARIDQEMALFGADPALVQAQAKIESQRAEITKELLTLLRS